jgi:hypothetical protein
MQRVAIARIVQAVDAVLRADARGEPLEPSALVLLLRQYVSTGRDDIAAAVGRGLARGLDAISDAGPTFSSGAAWLELFAEAAPLADDDRMRAAAITLASRLCGEWPGRGRVAPAMRSVSACLSASPVLDAPDRGRLIPAAVDELERIVGRIYRPGESIAHSLDMPDEDDGDLEDHVTAAAALLAAYAVTDRLPYSMLAEELMQMTLGRLASADFDVQCEMARVLCRLAMLHEDDEYRRTAVVAVRADYAAAAERILASAPAAYGHDDHARAATYGLALDEWLRTTREMQ